MNERIEQAARDIHETITGKVGTKSGRKPIIQVIVAVVKAEMHEAASRVGGGE